MMQIFRAKIKHPLTPNRTEVFPDGLLAVDEKGTIVAVGDYQKLRSRFSKEIPESDYRDLWMFPGFVDCHVHLPQLDCRNKCGLTLLDWLKIHIYPAEAAFKDPKVVEKTAPRFFEALLQHGITTAAVYSTVHYEATDAAFEMASVKGLRVVMGQVLMDQNAPSELLRPKRRLLQETERLISKWHGKNDRLFYAVTPRFALTCSKALLVGAGRLSQEVGCVFQTHMAETKEEIAEAKKLHRFLNYPEFYRQCDCTGERSLFAHAIHLEESEWEVLKESNSAVAHCPTSNVFLQSGTMPLARVEKFGLRCGLGTDVGAGPTFSMREIIDCGQEVHGPSKFDEAKAFHMATLGGAKALGLENRIGNFTVGKSADFVLFEKENFLGEALKTYVAGRAVWKSS